MVPGKEEFMDMFRRLHTPAVAEVLIRASVGIAGLGGLGSNAALLLARAGIGRVVLADYDIVELGNLNRQNYWLEHIGRPKSEALPEIIRRIQPYITIESHNVRLHEKNIPEIFRTCDVVVEAFDDPAAKQMIIETILSEMAPTWVVAASGIAGYGRYESLAVHRFERCILCGDGVSEVKEGVPLLAPRVCIVAATQADAVIEILMKKAGVTV